MSVTVDSVPLMSRDDAAIYLGIKYQTLALWASTGRYGLKFYRVGRSVKYRRSDLDQFIESRAVCADASA